MLNGHLRQQDPAPKALAHNQAMTADLYLFRSDAFGRGKDGQFDFDFREFVDSNRVEAGIL